jgi:uncharacterized protein YbjT (DUF2867 family)
MLRPSKHAHPDRTVFAAATILLRTLRGKRMVEFDDLTATLTATTGPSAEFLFLPAVSLLHILGLVEYHSTVDSFEYRGA